MEFKNTKGKEDKGFAIYHDLIINAGSTKVFKAISEPEHLVNWWPFKCSGIPEPGAEYNFYFTPEYDWFGGVVRCIPDRSFHIKMTKSDADWDPTTFGFDLQQIDGKVLLEFWHIGWPDCNAHYRRSSFCWAMLLNGLKDYVEKGRVIPFKNRE
jgi:uncharacterized protein YndB with AHSA1/START domain